MAGTRTGDPRRGDSPDDADWIFASSDPRTLPTERLPSRSEFDRYAAPLLARREEPALPAGEGETADLSEIDAAALRAAGKPRRPRPAVGRGDEPDAATGVIPAVDGEDSAGVGTPGVDGDTGAAAPRRSYARSGTTPNAEDDGRAQLSTITIPARFQDLGIFDALRDVLALICLLAALTTSFTLGALPVVDLVGRIALGVALVALVAVHLLRWIPATPNLRLVRAVRIIGLLPALLTAIGTIVADLVLSVPVLFASLPDGPPVGLGVGVSLLLLGSVVGIEPRAHEGYVPQQRARSWSRRLLGGVAAAAALALVVALVMIVGRVFTTGWQYSLNTFGSTVISVVLLGIVLASALRPDLLGRDRSWFVFSTGAVGGLVVLALADNTVRLQFAAPASFATSYVYLPFLFAAFGLMISRSFVRSMPVSFRRADWLVYTVRAMEFSALLHAAAVLWHLLAAITGTAGITLGGPVLHLVDAAVCACFVAVSLFARKALLERPAALARATGVVASVVLVVVGFLDIIVNSIAIGAGAGLTTGGTALSIGVAAALMLTVPAPVRDEFGAPDLSRMFADFRTHGSGRESLLARVPDVTEERSRKKSFPGS